MPFAPRSELDDRIERLQRHLTAQALDGGLLHGVSNLLYFAGTAQQAHLWVPRGGEPVLLVRRVLERARHDSALDRIEPLESLNELADHLDGARRVGMELDIMPVTLHDRYRRALPGLETSDLGPASRELRAVKSAYEIERVRRAAVAADATYREIVAALRPGMSELELSIVAEGAERRHGFQGMLRWRASSGFECPWVHVLAGDSSLSFTFTDSPFGGQGVSAAAPYAASHRAIEPGSPVCVDFALARDGYIHDMTRTLVVGQLPDELLRAHDVCRRIHDLFRAAARPGVAGEDLWQRCSAVADDAGLGEHFMGWGGQRVRFVGHGVGLELDELPVLAPRQRLRLEAGNVIALEPKMFFPGIGAVGLENTYAVHDDGIEKLTVSGDDITRVELPTPATSM
jgi:Xaa-Pro aminopeptidase